MARDCWNARHQSKWTIQIGHPYQGHNQSKNRCVPFTKCNRLCYISLYMLKQRYIDLHVFLVTVFVLLIGNLIFSQHPLYKAYDEEEEQKSNQSTPLHKRYAHDIALVELDRSVDVQSPYTRAICLPPVGDAIFGNDFEKREPGSPLMHDNTVDLFDVERKGQCWVTGWGYTADQGIHLCWFMVIWFLDLKKVVSSSTFH